MIEKSTLEFLTELDKNNNRDWFIANKKRFEAAQDNVIAFTGAMIGEIGKFDEAVRDFDPKACVFRIYRDVRFSKDKSPYKNNLGCWISPGGRRSMQPGYYFHIQPRQSFIAGGKHQPDGPELIKIRQYIASNTAEFLKIVEAKAFNNRFGKLFGEKLAKPPKGFDVDHPAIEYLKLKTFTAYREYHDDAIVASGDYVKLLTADAKAMFPLVDFLRRSLK